MVGKQEAMQLNLSWNEVELLEKTKAFVFENMPHIKNIEILLKSETKYDSVDNSKQIRENAVPGKPTAIFF